MQKALYYGKVPKIAASEGTRQKCKIADLNRQDQNRKVIITGRSLTAIIEGFLRDAQNMAPGGTCLNVST